MLLTPFFNLNRHGTTCLGIAATTADCRALATLAAERALWDERLPGD